MTLVELMVAITIGALITTAAATILLVGLRIYHKSNEKGLQQNEARLAITVMETLLAENEVEEIKKELHSNPVGQEAVYHYKILTTSDVLFSYDAGTHVISTGTNTEILTEVTAFEAVLDGELLTITMTAHGDDYTFVVFCRVNTTLSEYTSPQAVMTKAVDDKALTFGVRAFLKTLASQINSTGRIQTENGEGDWYSAWYIGGYENNPGWDADTPWCGCFISWALEENRGYLRGKTPKFANVDTFWQELLEAGRWKTEEPEAGDIIFFDWIVDGQQDPQHVGVVLSLMDEWVYTIEGNSNGQVVLEQYALDDPHIMGYGTLNWI